MDVPCKWSTAKGGSTNGLGDKPTNIPSSLSIRSELVGELVREKNAGEHVDVNQLRKQQKHYEAPLDIPPTSGVQSSHYFAKDGDRDSRAFSNLDDRKRTDEVDARANWMEFEGGSEVSTLN